MRAIFLVLCFFSSLFGGPDLIRDFSQNLSKDQRVVLQDFFAAVIDTAGGYVLYGDKPMSIDSYDLSSLRALSNPDPKAIAFMKGKELWEDFKVNPEKKDYLILSFDLDQKSYLVCINRLAFLNVVNENLSLFRYVLGPALTADGLINQLVNSASQFFSVLKNNLTLVELLQGHGKQNSILHARLTDISDPYAFGKTDEFPLISKKLSRIWAGSSKKFHKEPSFGFNSIQEEESKLYRLTAESCKIRPFVSCQIPKFECDPELEETKALLGAYEQSRAKILKTIASKTFLEDTLRKCFGFSDGTVELPAIPRQKELNIPISREETARKLSEWVHRKIAEEPYSVKKLQNAFLQGVSAREKGKQMPLPFRKINDFALIQREIEACKNLELANAYFEKLAAREDLNALIPNELYYKTLKSGKENTASSKTQKVSFQYSFQILGDQSFKDWGVVKQESIAALIPGLANGLIGMQQGEERVIYIHPKNAYGEETFFPPNASMIAQVRLLNWEEGEESPLLLAPHQLEQKDYRDVLAKFEVLRSEDLFDEGVAFWDMIKRSDEFLDFQTFQRFYLSESEGQNLSQNDPQEMKFLVDLQYHLLSLQKRH